MDHGAKELKKAEKFLAFINPWFPFDFLASVFSMKMKRIEKKVRKPNKGVGLAWKEIYARK